MVGCILKEGLSFGVLEFIFSVEEVGIVVYVYFVFLDGDYIREIVYYSGAICKYTIFG